MAEKKLTTDKKPERKPMKPETMTVLAICGVFFISLIMATGALQYILTILSMFSLVAYGIYQIKNREKKE